MKIENDNYVLTCETTPETAREKYYATHHRYDVLIPCERMPHHLRVWLVDQIATIATQQNIDECTVEEAIAIVQKLYDADAVFAARWKKALLSVDPKKLLSSPYCLDGYSVSSRFYFDGRSRDIDWKKYPDRKNELDAFAKEETARWLKEKQEKKEAEEKRRDEKNREAEEAENTRREALGKIIEKSHPIDLDRYRDGLMSEAEQRDILRDDLIPFPDGFENYRKIRKSDFCDCDFGDASFDTDEAASLTREEYAALKALKKMYSHCTVKAEAHTGSCDCPAESTITRICFLVDAQCGDWTVNRRVQIIEE